MSHYMKLGVLISLICSLVAYRPRAVPLAAAAMVSKEGHIAFLVDEGGYGHYTLHIVGEYGDFEQIYRTYHGVHSFDWSPGLKLLAITDGDFSSANISIVNPATETIVGNISTTSSEPHWSPDGRWLAFQVDNGTGHGFCVTPFPFREINLDSALYVQSDWCIGQVTALGTATINTIKSDFNPLRDDNVFLDRWSANGNQLVFYDIYTNQSYVINRDTTGFRKLDNDNKPPGIDPNMHVEDFAWSPNGTQIAFDGTFNPNPLLDNGIYLMNANGTAQRRLTPANLNATVPVWSPDGKKIAFYTTHTDPYSNQKLYVMNADGTNLIQLSADNLLVSDRVWSPDSQTIVFSVNNPNPPQR